MEDKKRLEKIFAEIIQITGVEDIGYHRIEGGRLVPVIKTNTTTLRDQSWKATHEQNQVQVKADPVLTEVMKSGEGMMIQDTLTDSRASKEFQLFNIKSIMVLPVKSNQQVKGILVVASIGKHHLFSEEQMSQCQALANQLS